jgi:hypothetical protein
MSVLTVKTQPAPSHRTARRATVLAATLGLLLAGGGCGKAEDGYLNLLALPEECEVDRRCAGLVGVNCRSEVDGPYYYVEGLTGRIVATCGGACMLGPQPEQGLCVECPPKEWTCR